MVIVVDCLLTVKCQITSLTAQNSPSVQILLNPPNRQGKETQELKVEQSTSVKAKIETIAIWTKSLYSKYLNYIYLS